MESKKNSNDSATNKESAKKGKDKMKSGAKKALPYMQNRELSWLAFNKRVLDQGEDHNVPLLERLTFVSIFSSNLQEFFMVRVGSLTDLLLIKKEIRDTKSQMTPEEQLNAIYDRCHELYPEQERIFTKIIDQLGEYGIHQRNIEDLTKDQEEYLRYYLHRNVSPYLSPQIINSRHPFPHLENGALYILLRLDEEQSRAQKTGSAIDGKKKKKNIGADDATFGLLPLPRQANRVIKLPGEDTQFILLENALKLLVDEVFSMYITKRASVICVTRNADIDPNDGVTEIDYDYREHMKRILKKRSRLAPVRLETDTPLSPVTEKFLLDRLNLNENQVFVTKVPLDMGYAWGLPSMVDSELANSLTSKPFTPQWPACLDEKRSIIEQVTEKDVLLSYPYESMDPFVKLLREAANDPKVLSIKITLYRLANQSHLAEALLTAAENGKEVTALFELRARFDESNNIEWSQRFEEAGAHVIYGFHEFKVHSKICTITRATDDGLQYITQLGTGNYNEKTSKLYTDFSFMTCSQEIGLDAAEFFRNMSLENASDNYSEIRVAPLQIKPMILEKIDEQIKLAKEGQPNGLLFKTNSVTDKDIINKIVEASQANVHTTLFVRGISCIVPGIEGYTDNVEVVSIVGRLLEHSRIYGFGPHDNMELYLSSADLMTRNMDKRVEIAWPVKHAELRRKIINYLDTCLSDTAKLRMLQSDKEFTPLEYFAEPNAVGVLEPFDSQNFLINQARTDYLTYIEQKEKEAKTRSVRSQTLDLLNEASAPLVPEVAPTNTVDASAQDTQDAAELEATQEVAQEQEKTSESAIEQLDAITSDAATIEDEASLEEEITTEEAQEIQENLEPVVNKLEATISDTTMLDEPVLAEDIAIEQAVEIREALDSTPTGFNLDSTTSDTVVANEAEQPTGSFEPVAFTTKDSDSAQNKYSAELSGELAQEASDEALVDQLVASLHADQLAETQVAEETSTEIETEIEEPATQIPFFTPAPAPAPETQTNVHATATAPAGAATEQPFVAPVQTGLNTSIPEINVPAAAPEPQGVPTVSIPVPEPQNTTAFASEPQAGQPSAPAQPQSASAAQEVVAEVIPDQESDAPIQLVGKKKPNFWQRLKFLFTGHF